MTSAARSDVWPVEGGHADASRFATLYRGHFTFTWSCLRRLGVPAAAIDDAAQELWVVAHRRLDQLRDPRAAKSWLYAIARRVASHHRRAEHRHRRKLDAVSWSSERENEGASRESELIVEAILDQLDPRVREAFVLSEIEGWTAPEIAKATGANANTVYWRVRVAKQELQSQLAAANDGTLDAVVIQLRDGTRPPKGAAKKCMAAIAPMLVPTSWLGGALSSFGALKAVILAVAAAGVTIGAIEIVEREPASVPAVVVEPPVVARAAAPVVVPEPPQATAAIAPVPERADVPVQVPNAVAKERSSARVSVVEPAAADASETQLLADARDAAKAGDHARTRALIAEHAARFPTSALADMRDLLEAKTLCAQGETQAARVVVARIVERAPTSAAATKAAGICGAAP